MTVVWLDGALVEPSRAALAIDDPGVRWGEGLFETMRAEGGRVALLDRHLARLRASAGALGMGPMPDEAGMRAAVAAALDAAGPGPARVRLTATPRPTLLVEVTPTAPLGAEPAAVRAIALRGAWSPADAMAQHKCLSYARHRASQRRALAAGADHALLLDAEGRLGEAAMANAFWVAGGRLCTAPARGLLPGVARAALMDAVPVTERVADEARWRGADEILLTSAVGGAMAVVEVDGRPVGEGAPGPWSRRAHAALRAALGAA